jgi:hypothetical protein
MFPSTSYFTDFSYENGRVSDVMRQNFSDVLFILDGYFPRKSEKTFRLLKVTYNTHLTKVMSETSSVRK